MGAEPRITPTGSHRRRDRNWEVVFIPLKPLTTSGTGSGTYSLKIVNSSSSPLLYVRNDGNVTMGLSSSSYNLHVSGTVSSNRGYNIGATAGWTGTFNTLDSEVVTVVGGIIISVI